MLQKLWLIQFVLLSTLLVCLTSCSGIKNYKYFQDIPDSLSITKIKGSEYKDPKIQSDDILYVAIQTVEPIAGSSINNLNSLGSTATNNGNNSSPSSVTGYLVDRAGNITIPILGDVLVAQQTTQQARSTITERAAKFYRDPSVIVRFVNFKITVLGEVQRPGSFTVPNEKVSVIDALGYAGDLTIYGKRDNILLLRHQADGSTMAIRMNLNKSNIFNSPYFYLQQNDQIYVEPNKAKISSSDGTQVRNISIASALLSFIVVLISRF